MSGYVLILADRRDLGADQLVVSLAELDACVVRVDPADFPQRVKLEAHLDPAVPGGWRITLRVQGDTLDYGVRVDLLTGIYQGRTGPYRLPTELTPAQRRWAHQQAHAGLGGLLAACERRDSTTPGTSSTRRCCRSSSPRPRRAASRCRRP